MFQRLLELTGEQLLDLGISAAMIVAAVVLGRWLIRLVLERILGRLIERTETTIDDMMMTAAQPPVYTLLIAFVAEIAYSRLDFFPQAWDSAVASIFFVIYLVIGSTLVLRLVRTFFDWYQGRLEETVEVEFSEQLLPFFRRIVTVVIVGIALIMFLRHFEVDVSGLVATLGITSVAIALAAQAALEDTISGFLIILDQPYRIGDRIEIIDLDTVGDVQDIGLRSSRILTLDNRMIVVPNSLIGKSLVVNQSYPDTLYRTETTVGVAYGTDLEKARQVIIDAVRGTDMVIKSRPVEALFMEFGDSSLNFQVRWWVNVPIDVRYIADQVNSSIYNALAEADIEIPFPQRDVNLNQDAVEQLAKAINGRG